MLAWESWNCFKDYGAKVWRICKRDFEWHGVGLLFEYFFENWTSISLSTKQHIKTLGPSRSIRGDRYGLRLRKKTQATGVWLVSITSPDELLSDAKHQKHNIEMLEKVRFCTRSKWSNSIVGFIFLIPRPNQGLHRWNISKTTGDGDVVKLLRAFRLVRTARLCFGVEFFQTGNHRDGRREFGHILLISPDGFCDLSCIERLWIWYTRSVYKKTKHTATDETSPKNHGKE